MANNPRTKIARSARPLAGCRVLVSRAKKQAGALSSALRELGCEVIEIPFIEIRKPISYQPLDSALRNLATYDWLILTSVNGVEALFERVAKKKIDASALAHLKIAAIGPATRKAIEQHGLRVSVTPKEYVAESVVASLHRRVKGKRVLLVRAKVARDVIPRELREAGAEIDVVEAYETVAPKSSEKRLRALAGQPNTEAARHHLHQFVHGEKLRRVAGIAWRSCCLEEAGGASGHTHGIHRTRNLRHAA